MYNRKDESLGLKGTAQSIVSRLNQDQTDSQEKKKNGNIIQTKTRTMIINLQAKVRSSNYQKRKFRLYQKPVVPVILTKP